MKKKIFALCLVCAMAVSLLAGCGSQSTTTASSSEAGSQSTSQTGEVPTITVWAWDSAFNGTAIEEAAKLYDGANVEFVEMSKADCLQKIHTVLASGVTDDLPDIVLISDLAAQGYLMSYPGAFKSMDGILDYSQFASYKVEAVTYDEIGYGIPFDTGVAGLFYRTDYIEEAGYTQEDMQNLTWDEYMVLGEKLKEAGHMLQTYNPNDIAEFQIMLQSAGKWYTEDDNTADFANNEVLKQCFEIFKTFNESDYVKVVSDWSEFTGAINNGDVACVIRGSWISSSIMAAEDQSGKWAVAPVPSLDVEGATNKSNQGGSSWFVLENGANSDVAADFMAKTFGESTELYNTLLQAKNIVCTYLPAASVEAYDMEQEFYGGQKVNADLAAWLAEIPAVNTGAFTAEAQTSLLSIVPEYLAGGDLDKLLNTASQQFTQLTQ